MITAVEVIHQRRAWFARGGRVAAFNSLVREALEFAAQHWIDDPDMLASHFEPGASSRYGYPQRSAKYLRVKQYAAKVRSWPQGRWAGAMVQNPNYHKSPAPYVYSGDLKEFVLGNARSGNMRPKAVATSNVQRVEVKVQYSHPLRTTDAGMITKMTDGQRDKLFRIFVKKLHELMAATPTIREQSRVTATAA